MTWLAGEQDGTTGLAVAAATLTPIRRYDLPFGGPRGTAPTGWPGERGFAGGTVDASTGLVHLGAREHDAATGRFISVDPVADAEDPQQLQGYAYASNSPVTFADPDGRRAALPGALTTAVTPATPLAGGRGRRRFPGRQR